MCLFCFFPKFPGHGHGSPARDLGFGRAAGALGGERRPRGPPAPLPTSCVVRDDGHGEVHFLRVHVRGGADGIVTRLQKGQLGQEQGGGHLDGLELLQHLHDGGVLIPFPFLVLLQALHQGEGQRRIRTQLQIQISIGGSRGQEKRQIKVIVWSAGSVVEH